ncbi:MAG: ribosomal-processing cysteine protease Prp [Bacilli bacterium]|nr:ribosomal-processing cysteine protease Prp [Bacilli bacterium]
MIKVEVVKEKDLYKKVSIIGHAMYADYGKDIVCSAVSSIVTTTINGCIALDKDSLSYEVNDKGVYISNIVEGNTQTLINNMVSLLKELEEKYPTNIKVM